MAEDIKIISNNNDSLLKNAECYGLAKEESKELFDTFSLFIDGCKLFVNSENKTYDLAKDIIANGNKISSYGGYILLHNMIINHGVDFISNIILSFNKIHDELFAEDSSSTKTNDVYETIATFASFVPSSVLRHIAKNNFDQLRSILTKMHKRPSAMSNLLSCLAEMHLLSKGNLIYSELMLSELNNFITFLSQKNNVVKGIPDAVNISLKEIKNIVKEYISLGNKKQSLKEVNKLVNKKADIGQTFFGAIILNQSCMIKILELDIFTTDLIVNFMKQMRVYNILETLLIMYDRGFSKISAIFDKIAPLYNLHSIDECVDKLSDLIDKDDNIYKYGILSRTISLLPNYYLINEDDSIYIGVEYLKNKLINLVNNLTSLIAEKSLSITISSLSRSKSYIDIFNKANKELGLSIEIKEGSHLAKLQESDVIKKIKEGCVSILLQDQESSARIIKIFDIISELLKNKNTKIQDIPNLNMLEFINECHMILIKENQLIYMKSYVQEICEIVIGKILKKSDINNQQEDIID